jgi:BirA family transcriptional regulator, biotin operon repressor / biotin---[acetyl-CoA-carboxylase] ligase
MIGRPRVHHALTDSTNERARELAASGAVHGTLVTADEQSAGRGRQGREWVAPARSAVLMSVLLREFDALLPLRAAVAVAEACGSEEIKWPNDVWLGGRKVAGILVEGRPAEGWAVLGIGVNVAPVSFPPDLHAVALDDGRGVPAVLQVLLVSLERWLAADDVLPAWRQRDALRGRHVSWGEGSGTAAGIDDSGALLVNTAEGQVALQAGEVHLVL